MESDEEDADDWLKEENTEITGTSKTSMSFEDDEDVSFSDLEEDDQICLQNQRKWFTVLIRTHKIGSSWKSSTDLSRDTGSINQIGSVKETVQNPDSKESNDWLDIDDIELRHTSSFVRLDLSASSKLEPVKSLVSSID
ncbi:hypothetical protein HAX54_011313 [Datura stramonium]|uniref:Uncharacterized protein n=1 Tax=Datura stramonium TaxID=4076 RepID=A0ABS8TJM1_DATST|nr:hypothetical protein [Datura stramonium]